MRYVVHCIDHEGGLPRRLANYEAHKAYLASGSVKTVVSGPLVADDGQSSTSTPTTPSARRGCGPTSASTRSS